MPNKEHLRILKRGVEVWNQWRKEVPDDHPCLSGADLRGMDLSIQGPVSLEHPRAGKFLRNLYRQRHYVPRDLGIDFHGVELNGARLNEANLFRADLTGAMLHRTKLTGANLREARLDDVHMTDATLVGTDLTGARLNFAHLRRANLREADLRKASLVEADLTEADLTWANLQRADAHSAIISKANLAYADLTNTSLHDAMLAEADLSHARLIGTILYGATIAGCRTYGASVWNIQSNETTKQKGLIVTPKDRPTVRVDEIEVAQFVYLLLDRKKLRNVLDTITSKAVLVLGRYTPERKSVLNAIADELRNYGLLPIIFDFERPTNRDFTETIKILAGMSLFVIVDLSEPKSVPQELTAAVPNYRIPFVPILQEGEEPYSMFGDLTKYEWVLKPVLTYRTTDVLLANFKSEIIDRAWKKHLELQRKRNEQLEMVSIDQLREKENPSFEFKGREL